MRYSREGIEFGEKSAFESFTRWACTAVVFFGLNALSETNSDVLKKVWKVGATEGCTRTVRAQFNSSQFNSLNAKIKNQDDREELGQILNPWLKKLGWSHTDFYTPKTETYYLFKNYVATFDGKRLPSPRIVNPGVQVGHDVQGFYAREILNNFPAANGGLRKNDRLLVWKGVAFDGTWGSKPDQGLLEVNRAGQPLSIRIRTLALDWNQAFLDATKRSVRFWKVDGKTIGYVHLWSGLHQESAQVLQNIVSKMKPDLQGLVLDIRGGYGGAWYDHLDSFFADTSTYFESESTNGDDKTEVGKADVKVNAEAYLGPLVVLINGGSRSGKEAMAYQFKKSHRATLVGEKTAGYFSTGGFHFADESTDYVLYLCTTRLTLDHNVIEGVGISPDVEVPYAGAGPFHDSQLQKALEIAASKSP